MSDFFRRYLLPGFVFESAVIAGGYATGRELVQFFLLPAGPWGGLLGMTVAMLFWSAVLMVSFELARMAKARLPYISVLTDPTTGGVSASLAMLGDVNIGEPKALIGFAGARVIQQTVRETLPEGFQRSEFLLEKGALDMIVDRRDMRERIAGLLTMFMHKPTPQPKVAA